MSTAPDIAREDSRALDAIDRRLVVETQSGLPLTPRPYLEIARKVGLTEDAVIARMQGLLECGAIRRIGAVPNHYRLGFRANGMSVWDLPDEDIGRLGRMIGELAFVSHAYHRPRRLPLWPYNLFAMVHGRTRDEVEDKVAEIAALLGEADRGHRVLYSTRILKKTGLRLAG